MMNLLTALGIGALFGLGLFQLLRRNLIRSATGLVILANAVNLYLLAAGAYRGQSAPYDGLVQPSDPLPQALVLTAIVISMGGLAFVLALLYGLSVRYRTADLDEVSELQG